MSCQKVCKLCPNLAISTSVAYDATTDTLNITIPTVAYRNCEKVCIVIAQAIPATTTITALVNIIVGTGTFPLLRCDCTQATACEVQTRTKYCTQVVTNTTSGVFKLMTKTACLRPTNLSVLPIDAVTTTSVGSTTEIALANITPLKTTKTKTITTKEVISNE
jgi:hypothetical protein